MELYCGERENIDSILSSRFVSLKSKIKSVEENLKKKDNNLSLLISFYKLEPFPNLFFNDTLLCIQKKAKSHKSKCSTF